MNTRKTISLVLLISFIPLILSSFVLYLLAPHGGPTAAMGWTWLGLGKRQWADIHLNLGLLFLAAGVVHLCYNWRAIVAYMKNKKKNLHLATPAFGLALAINLLFIGGTFFKIPPFSNLLELGRPTNRTAVSQQIQQESKTLDAVVIENSEISEDMKSYENSHEYGYGRNERRGFGGYRGKRFHADADN